MATVRDIYAKLCEFAPVSRKADFDNVGFLAGRAERQVEKAVVSLDITSQVIKETAEYGAQLIVSHHPVFFSLKSVTDTDYNGRRVVELLENGISAICMHTNLDGADRGVNACLAEAVGICGAELLLNEGTDEYGNAYSYGRAGYIKEPVSLEEYIKTVKGALKTRGIRYHDAKRPVHKVAVVGGSGGSYLGDVIKKGCDTFITADVKYDVFLEAKAEGINLIDADHFCTENIAVPILKDVIERGFPEVRVKISQVHGQTAYFC